ncbi:hypothetical protein [Leucobacter luti]|uniref:Uncharacterized protein n=1 Tax=Leucobacter luti TaxID=340320 RepID=A0A4Q7U1H0_9MICO|nr:hypothetical protein [Leucobacter luti]MBL3698999.1 hypothetical protein [Leucobacter luti]RZT66378.1 hypothetical protein EV139_1815 [Leucobacter luti]
MQNIDPKNMINTTGWMKVPASKLPQEKIPGRLDEIRVARNIMEKIFASAGEELERIEALPEHERSEAAHAKALEALKEGWLGLQDVELQYAAALLQRGRSLEGESSLVLVP